MRKILALLLTASCLSSAARAEDRSLLPSECLPADGCLCFSAASAQKIAKELTYAQVCRYEVTKLREFADRADPVSHNLKWFQEPEILVGGLIIGVSFGGVLGWLVSKN